MNSYYSPEALRRCAALASGAVLLAACGPISGTTQPASEPSSTSTEQDHPGEASTSEADSLNPALKYHTSVQPGSAIAFGTDAEIGWRLAGQGGSPSPDGNISAAPVDTGYTWPGTRLLTTRDAGQTWSEALGAAELPVGIWGFDMVDPSLIFAVGVENVLKSTDGGGSWQIEEIPGSPVTAVDFVDDESGIALAVDGTAQRTVDGGKSWALLNGEPGPLSSVCVDTVTGTLVAVTQNGELATTNDFKSWKTRPVFDSPQSEDAPPVWSQVVCNTDGVIASVDRTPGLESSQMGEHITALFDANNVEQAEFVRLPQESPASTVHPLSTGAPPIQFEYFANTWGVAVLSARGDILADPSVIGGLLEHPLRSDATGELYLKLHGGTCVGRLCWLVIANTAKGTAKQPLTTVDVLKSADGGRSWTVLSETAPELSTEADR